MDEAERYHWEWLDDQRWMLEGSKLEKKAEDLSQGEVYLGTTLTIIRSMSETLRGAWR